MPAVPLFRAALTPVAAPELGNSQASHAGEARSEDLPQAPPRGCLGWLGQQHPAPATPLGGPDRIASCRRRSDERVWNRSFSSHSGPTYCATHFRICCTTLSGDRKVQAMSSRASPTALLVPSQKAPPLAWSTSR